MPTSSRRRTVSLLDWTDLIWEGHPGETVEVIRQASSTGQRDTQPIGCTNPQRRPVQSVFHWKSQRCSQRHRKLSAVVFCTTADHLSVAGRVRAVYGGRRSTRDHLVTQEVLHSRPHSYFSAERVGRCATAIPDGNGQRVATWRSSTCCTEARYHHAGFKEIVIRLQWPEELPACFELDVRVEGRRKNRHREAW